MNIVLGFDVLSDWVVRVTSYTRLTGRLQTAMWLQG